MPGLEHKDERLHAAETGELDTADATDGPCDETPAGADWRDQLAALRARLGEQTQESTP